MINSDQSNERDLPSTEKDETEQVPTEPKRVIHRPARVSGTGETNRRPLSLFRLRVGSWRRKNGHGGRGNLHQTSTSSENVTNEDQRSDLETEKLATGVELPNPGQLLRDLENAGKISQQTPIPDEAADQPVDVVPSRQIKTPNLTMLLPSGEKTRRAFWDVGSGISLIVNIILVVVVLLMAIQINTLKRTMNNLLGGLYNNFVRMDNSVIYTTINMTDVPIPINFNLPVVQPETNVTLTRPVTVQSARVTISSGVITINNAPATVTLPAGTVLPVSLQMEVPVQTTVLVNLQVPVNIKLAEASSPDINIGNLHTAFTGLQDTIGPLFCRFDPLAQDYMNNFLCNAQGDYIPRSPINNP